MNLRAVKARSDLPALLNELDLTGYGVEVGVFTGFYARMILATWTGEKLYLVDPWHDQRDYKDAARCNEWTGNGRLRDTLERLKSFEGRFEIIRKHSPEAADEFEDDSLDFVYVDGNHSYQGAKADIRGWWRKVAPGGLLMGHDYFDAIPHPSDTTYTAYGYLKETPANPETLTTYGVRAAVDEFVKEHGVKLVVTTVEDPPSWYFRK